MKLYDAYNELTKTAGREGFPDRLSQLIVSSIP
jgi:hypothetical protein